ncbi:MAG TPA: T9SS type A sorting domain-containing protein [Chitinophagaceae bacterium]|nr:T9SS type A sorting domain-containing protein [Chitinophagaceae bacterium]HNF70904.1 T9SS type A sorting domain-containing protein [Chitinophagaceae bacterium]
MKTRKLPFVLSIMAGLAVYLIFSSNSGGISGQSSAGCGGSTCHSSSSSTTLALTGIPVTGYVPGTTYTLTFSVSNSSKAAAGFDLTCSGGTLSGAPSGTMIMSGNEIHHTSPKNALSGITSWSFSWTAPTAPTPVVFNFAGNAVDNLGSSANDAWAVSSTTATAATTTVTPPSVIMSTVTSITQTTASISGSVNANGASTSVSIDYGLTTSYGSNMVTTPGTVIGTSASAVGATLSLLTPGTLYHYRIKATNSAGTTNGPDGTFTTLPTAVNDFEKAGFMLYPNPATDQMLLQSREMLSGIEVDAVNLLGQRTVLTWKQQGDRQIAIETDDLSPGNYLLHVKHTSGNYYKHFQKK